MSHNRLGDESSPYLLQHRDNPVHWWPWGPEALAEAKRTGKPILLSVGYSACHWCHVMAHESFEDAATAAVMNERFVNIKVDREERPDIDAIYMTALHRLGQQGGWPLTMFLDTDARPFWGGTYFPKVPTYGRPAFVEVLTRLSDAFHNEPEKVAGNANAITASLAQETATGDGPAITDPLIREIVGRLARLVDPVHGGITGAPKFPQWTFFWLLWRGAIRYRDDAAKQAVITTLRKMSDGGIYDHLGGGYARYSVDELWLVPHFEKMLYDNALLIDLMTDVWRETHDPVLKARVAETVAWITREMVVDGGGFASALDADSVGEEGKFYVWSADEIERVLGAEDAAVFAAAYDVSAEGNWEGHNILNRLQSKARGTDEEEARLAAMRDKLLAARDSRERPGWDDKVLADWNGLMIGALARAGTVFGRSDWVTMARQAFTYVGEKMTVSDRIVHAVRNGQGRAPGTAHDCANMISAAIRLYQATSEADDLAQARRWVEILDRHYWSEDASGYFTAADDTQDVIVRLRTASDDATPAANATMISNLTALASLTGDTSYVRRAESILRAFSADLAKNLVAHTGLLAAAMDLLAPQLVVLLTGRSEETSDLGSALRGLSIPGAVEVEVEGSIGTFGPPGLHGKSTEDGKSTAYVCVGTQCSLPVTTEDDLRQAVLELRSVARDQGTLQTQ